jgi:hypothetical protein
METKHRFRWSIWKTWRGDDRYLPDVSDFQNLKDFIMQTSSHTFRCGFTGVGALMDPGYLRTAIQPQYQSDADSNASIGEWAVSVVRRVTGWLTARLHRAG